MTTTPTDTQQVRYLTRLSAIQASDEQIQWYLDEAAEGLPDGIEGNGHVYQAAGTLAQAMSTSGNIEPDQRIGLSKLSKLLFARISPVSGERRGFIWGNLERFLARRANGDF